MYAVCPPVVSLYQCVALRMKGVLKWRTKIMHQNFHFILGITFMCTWQQWFAVLFNVFFLALEVTLLLYREEKWSNWKMSPYLPFNNFSLSLQSNIRMSFLRLPTLNKAYQLHFIGTVALGKHFQSIFGLGKADLSRECHFIFSPFTSVFPSARPAILRPLKAALYGNLITIIFLVFLAF